ELGFLSAVQVVSQELPVSGGRKADIDHPIAVNGRDDVGRVVRSERRGVPRCQVEKDDRLIPRRALVNKDHPASGYRRGNLAGRTIGQPAPGVELAVGFAEREGGDDMKGGSAGEARRAGPDRRGAAGEAGHNSVLINRGDDQVVRRPGDCHTTHDPPVLVGEVCRVLCPSSEVEGRGPGHRQLTRMNARRTILSAPDENYESSNQPQVNRCLAHTPSLEPPRPSWPPRPSAFPPSRSPPQLPDNRF